MNTISSDIVKFEFGSLKPYLEELKSIDERIVELLPKFDSLGGAKGRRVDLHNQLGPLAIELDNFDQSLSVQNAVFNGCRLEELQDLRDIAYLLRYKITSQTRKWLFTKCMASTPASQNLSRRINNIAKCLESIDQKLLGRIKDFPKPIMLSSNNNNTNAQTTNVLTDGEKKSVFHALELITSISVKVQTSTSVKDLDQLELFLDSTRMQLNLFSDSPGEKRMLAETKAKAAYVRSQISMLRRNFPQMANTVVTNFVAEFLGPYIAGRLDPATEPLRPNLFVQLQELMVANQIQMSSVDLASLGAAAFIKEGIRGLWGRIVGQACNKAINEVPPDADVPPKVVVPPLLENSEEVVQFKKMTFEALKREFCGHEFVPALLEEAIHCALESLQMAKTT
ncbi:MAG: hypothetical protein Q8K75_05170 [Chlamydiales bacterium]|nr:hypothetical protein [Chlamydiales bacterium]